LIEKRTCAVVKSACWKTEIISMYWLQVDISSRRAVNQQWMKWFTGWRNTNDHYTTNCNKSQNYITNF